MSILDANGSVACAECGRKARDERDKLLDGFHAMQQLYEDELKHALAENAKLREELELWHRLTAGIELPEYPTSQFKPKDLERENAKLREQMEYALQTSRARLETIDRLKAENAKLRELVRDMWSDFHHDYQCSWEGLCKDPLCKYNGECSYENRMHELGVGVDE